MLSVFIFYVIEHLYSLYLIAGLSYVFTFLPSSSSISSPPPSPQVEYKPVTANATFSHPVVPPVQVPLSPTECMCKSLEQTAQSVQMNNLVHTCETSAGCTGVRCLISALGQTGYVETIILPCQQALDVLVEDESFTPVSRQVFYRTESRNLNIRGNSICSDVTIIPRDYSMDIAVSSKNSFCVMILETGNMFISCC